MSTPDPVAGLGPLDAEPVSLYPPYARRGGWAWQPRRPERYSALLTALDGVELGSHDVRVLDWLATGLDAPTVATLCSLIHRAHATGHHEGSTHP